MKEKQAVGSGRVRLLANSAREMAARASSQIAEASKTLSAVHELLWAIPPSHSQTYCSGCFEHLTRPTRVVCLRARRLNLWICERCSGSEEESVTLEPLATTKRYADGR